MKKLKALALVAFVAVLCMGAALTTTTAGYENLVTSAAGGETDLAAATGYAVGIPAPGTAALNPKDLMTSGGDSKANNVVLICSASGLDAATAGMSVYGLAIGGPPEKIASITWTLGTASKTTSSQITERWADTAAVTGTHLTAVSAVDSGNNRAAKVVFDATGYRYLYGIVHTATGAETIKVTMRPF